MICQRLALKNCCAYRMHERFAWLPCMETLAFNVKFTLNCIFGKFNSLKKPQPNRHNFEINQVDDTFNWSHQFILTTGYSF